MEPLAGPIRPYAWGSRTAIAAIQGRPVPSPTPEAELWLGAHPGAPATVRRAGRPLSLVDLVAADPERTLGPAQRFGRLPFLLKLLAAAEPLSLQAHPDAAGARAGFDAEEAAGVALDAPGRNYVDPYHKPEMLCAVTDFEALCGFRAPDVSAGLLAALAVPALEPIVAALRGGDLRGAVTALLELPDGSREDTVGAAVEAARRLVAEHPADDAEAVYPLLVDLGERYPGDAGVLVASLLNRVRLRPGQALYAPAGYLHMYLCGVGMELLAASDNVLRGGLTPKHVDAPELLRVLRFEPGPPPVADPAVVGPGVDAWPTLPGIDDFALRRARVGGPYPKVELPGTGPRILFCLTGTVIADDGTEPVTLTAGRAAFVPASSGRVRLTGFGEVFQATTA